MHISIWQQWASNHSGSFAIVGVFESAEAAKAAKAKVEEALRSIEDYYHQHQDQWIRLASYDGFDIADAPPVSPPEVALGKEYEVKWRQPIDWYDTYQIKTINDHLVLLTSEGQIQTGPRPLDEIMGRLGGTIYVDTDSDEGGVLYIIVDLTCVAPDDDTAGSICEAVQKHLEEIQRTSSIAPWGSVLWQGSVTLDGQHLSFSNLGFGVFGQGFVGMLDYLKRKRCTDISYVLRQEK